MLIIGVKNHFALPFEFFNTQSSILGPASDDHMASSLVIVSSADMEDTT